MGRKFLIAAQLIATVMFMSLVPHVGQAHWSTWVGPLLLLLLIVVNSIWFSRLGSWLIFCGAFSALLLVLSAFTLRWRLETGFRPAPFYKAMLMYAAMVYASLAQIKLNAGPRAAGDNTQGGH